LLIHADHGNISVKPKLYSLKAFNQRNKQWARDETLHPFDLKTVILVTFTK